MRVLTGKDQGAQDLYAEVGVLTGKDHGAQALQALRRLCRHGSQAMQALRRLSLAVFLQQLKPRDRLPCEVKG